MRIDVCDISNFVCFFKGICMLKYIAVSYFLFLSGFKHAENSLEKVQTKRMNGIIKAIIFHVIHISLSFVALRLYFF